MIAHMGTTIAGLPTTRLFWQQCTSDAKRNFIVVSCIHSSLSDFRAQHTTAGVVPGSPYTRLKVIAMMAQVMLGRGCSSAELGKAT